MNLRQFDRLANQKMVSRELDQGHRYDQHSQEIIAGQVAEILRREAAIHQEFDQIFAVTGNCPVASGYETPWISLGLMPDGVRQCSSQLNKGVEGGFWAAFKAQEPGNPGTLVIETEHYQTETAALVGGCDADFDLDTYFHELKRKCGGLRGGWPTPAALFLKHLVMDDERLERAAATQETLATALSDPALNPAFAEAAAAAFTVAEV